MKAKDAWMVLYFSEVARLHDFSVEDLAQFRWEQRAVEFLLTQLGNQEAGVMRWKWIHCCCCCYRKRILAVDALQTEAIAAELVVKLANELGVAWTLVCWL